MSETTIAYHYLVPDEGPTTATWTGNRTDALQAAILALDAKHDGDGYWAYHPEELREELAGEALVVSAEAMVELGAGLCAGHELDALYDPWCANTAAVPSESARQRLAAFWMGLGDHVEELSDDEIRADLDAFGITEEDVAALKNKVLAMVARAKERVGDAELFVATDPVEPWPETKPVDDIPD